MSCDAESRAQAEVTHGSCWCRVSSILTVNHKCLAQCFSRLVGRKLRGTISKFQAPFKYPTNVGFFTHGNKNFITHNSTLSNKSGSKSDDVKTYTLENLYELNVHVINSAIYVIFQCQSCICFTTFIIIIIILNIFR